MMRFSSFNVTLISRRVDFAKYTRIGQLHFEYALSLLYELQFSSQRTVAALPLGLIFSVDSFEVHPRAVSVRNNKRANSAS